VSFLVDTNVISEIRKGARADRRVMRWLDETDDDDLRLSVLVLGELRQGVERLRARDGASAQRLDHWLSGLADRYKGRILPVDEPVAQLWGDGPGSRSDARDTQHARCRPDRRSPAEPLRPTRVSGCTHEKIWAPPKSP
jgi:predicted nucleic acid-binding protein